MSGKKQKTRINHPEAEYKEIEIVFLKSTDFTNREEMDAKEAALEGEHPGTNVVKLIEVDGTGCAIWKADPDSEGTPGIMDMIDKTAMTDRCSYCQLRDTVDCVYPGSIPDPKIYT